MNNWKTSHWKDRLIRFFSVGVITLLAVSSWAEQPSVAVSNDGFHDGIDRDAPDFVIASLLIMGPGDELYACAGHAALRMECPSFNLDFCFSYEGESVRNQVFTFLCGKLKMGMFAIPTEEYLKDTETTNQGYVQYKLNLPIAVKRKLWELLDNKVDEGVELPYDYVQRGCAQSLLVLLRKALEPVALEVPFWPAKYEWSRREFVDSAAKAFPWNRFFLHSIMGVETDRNVLLIERVVLPNDLLDFLRTARVKGVPVITEPGVELLPQVATYSAPWVTPIMVAWLCVALAVVYLFLTRVLPPSGKEMSRSASPLLPPSERGGAQSAGGSTPCGTPAQKDCRGVGGSPAATSNGKRAKGNVAGVLARILSILFLSIQSLAGLFFFYLVFISDLPATGWNWLVIPFNPLPLVFWKWRRRWALGFVGILVAWEAYMLLSPHRLTDPAYLVLVAAYAVFYAAIGWRAVQEMRHR